MKKTLLILFAMMAFTSLRAEQVKVKAMNSDKIKVSGKIVRINDTFDIDTPIVWPSDSAYMVVYTMESPTRRYVIVAGEMRKKEAKSCRQFITSNNLYTRSLNVRRPSDTMYLADTLYIPMAVGSGSNIKSELRLCETSAKIPLSHSVDGDNYVITRDLFKTKRSGAVVVDIWDMDKVAKWSYCSYKKLCIIVLPRRL